MLRNYLLVALRSLGRNKTHTLVNVFGLSLGVASCLLIFLYLHFEWTYDRMYSHADRIYRVEQLRQFPGRDPEYSAGIPAVWLEQVGSTIPEIETAVRISGGATQIRHNNSVFANDILYADSTFFQVFDTRVLEGNPETMLDRTDKVVLSSELAKKIFPNEDALGKTLEMNVEGSFEPFVVSGVIAPMAENSTVQGDLILNFKRMQKQIADTYGDGWGSIYSNTYIKLAPGTDPSTIDSASAQTMRALDEEHRDDDSRRQYFLHALTRVHVALSNPLGKPTDTEALPSLVLFAIGLIILAIAAINFTTLSISRSAYRSHEVGVRKTLGAGRSQIMKQFWLETGLTSLFAVILGVGLGELVLPAFNTLAERHLDLAFNPATVAMLAILWFVIVFAAGSYPALVMAGFPPVKAFHDSTTIGGGGRLRRVLLVIQFGLSICLIAMTLVMNRQLRYVQTKSLGYNGDQVISLPVYCRDDSGQKVMERLRNDLAGDPNVAEVTGASNSFNTRWTDFRWMDNGKEYRDIFQNTVDYEFLNTLEIPLAAGRDFSREHPTDLQKGLIVNEALVRYFNIEDPVGKTLPGNRQNGGTIIGVVHDFNYTSLHTTVKPLVLTLTPFRPPSDNFMNRSENYATIQYVLVRLKAGNIPVGLSHVEDAWLKVAPDIPFHFTFVDEQVGKQYRADQRWGKIVGYASLLAIVIALLGLFGLASLEVVRRTREIGIRKVLGASEGSIVRLLAREITILVLVACVAAWPVAYLVMHRWLNGFAFRVAVSPVLLLLAGVTAIAVAWITVGLLAWRAANANPVNALRHE